MNEPRIHERDLLEAAGQLLRWAELARTGARIGVDERTADTQVEVIAVAARGMVAHARLEVLDGDAFTGAPRLFAWTCATSAARQLGRHSTFMATRYLLGTCTVFARGGRHELPHDVAIELYRETAEELDAAEDLERPSIEAIGRLLAHQRAQRARAWLSPVLEGIDRGQPLVDTAQRIRDGADIFEGRTEGRRDR